MRLSLLSSVFITVILCTSCQRSGSQVWQDTKTAGRYIGCAFRSLRGKHPDLATDERVYVSERFEEDDFIPLDDADLYQKILAGDASTLYEITADTPIPQSRANPGEKGSGIPGIEGFSEPRGSLAETFKRIHFDTDKYDIKGHENLATLRNIASYMKKHPKVYVFVEGHCDERGTQKYNLSLGSRRSNAVRNFLIREGVNLDHVLTTTYGKERPLAAGHDTESWAANRRSQFKLYEKN